MKMTFDEAKKKFNEEGRFDLLITKEEFEAIQLDAQAELRIERDTLLAKVKELEKFRSALFVLCQRLELVHDNPLYQSVWLSAANHGINYSKGIKYEKELAAAKALFKDTALNNQPKETK